MMTVDEYDFGQLIGRGAFASVYRARDRSASREELAIKIIHKGNLDASMIARVLNEKSLHSNLVHDHIIAYRCFFEDKDNFYLCQELALFGTLYKHIQQYGPLPQSCARVLVYQLLQAVAYLHSNGIAHRDIKLSNILISGIDCCDNSGDFSLAFANSVEPTPNRPLPRTIKLCDFGLATRIQHPDEEHFTICGTPNYLAPEIASEQAHGLPVDLWSLGVLFYCMIVGTAPFESYQAPAAQYPTSPTLPSPAASSAPPDIRQTIQKIIAGDYKLPPETLLAPLGQRFLQELLQVNPLKRATAASLMLNKFFHGIDEPNCRATSSSATIETKATIILDSKNVQGIRCLSPPTISDEPSLIPAPRCESRQLQSISKANHSPAGPTTRTTANSMTAKNSTNPSSVAPGLGWLEDIAQLRDSLSPSFSPTVGSMELRSRTSWTALDSDSIPFRISRPFREFGHLDGECIPLTPQWINAASLVAPFTHFCPRQHGELYCYTGRDMVVIVPVLSTSNSVEKCDIPCSSTRASDSSVITASTNTTNSSSSSSNSTALDTNPRIKICRILFSGEPPFSVSVGTASVAMCKELLEMLDVVCDNGSTACSTSRNSSGPDPDSNTNDCNKSSIYESHSLEKFKLLVAVATEDPHIMNLQYDRVSQRGKVIMSDPRAGISLSRRLPAPTGARAQKSSHDESCGIQEDGRKMSGNNQERIATGEGGLISKSATMDADMSLSVSSKLSGDSGETDKLSCSFFSGVDPLALSISGVSVDSSHNQSSDRDGRGNSAASGPAEEHLESKDEDEEEDQTLPLTAAPILLDPKKDGFSAHYPCPRVNIRRSFSGEDCGQGDKQSLTHSILSFGSIGMRDRPIVRKPCSNPESQTLPRGILAIHDKLEAVVQAVHANIPLFVYYLPSKLAREMLSLDPKSSATPIRAVASSYGSEISGYASADSSKVTNVSINISDNGNCNEKSIECKCVLFNVPTLSSLGPPQCPQTFYLHFPDGATVEYSLPSGDVRVDLPATNPSKIGAQSHSNSNAVGEFYDRNTGNGRHFGPSSAFAPRSSAASSSGAGGERTHKNVIFMSADGSINGSAFLNDTSRNVSNSYNESNTNHSSMPSFNSSTSAGTRSDLDGTTNLDISAVLSNSESLGSELNQAMLQEDSGLGNEHSNSIDTSVGSGDDARTSSSSGYAASSVRSETVTHNSAACSLHDTLSSGTKNRAAFLSESGTLPLQWVGNINNLCLATSPKIAGKERSEQLPSTSGSTIPLRVLGYIMLAQKALQRCLQEYGRRTKLRPSGVRANPDVGIIR